MFLSQHLFRWRRCEHSAQRNRVPDLRSKRRQTRKSQFMDKSSGTFCFLLHSLILTQNQKFFRPYIFTALNIYITISWGPTQKYQRSKETSRPEDGSSGFLQNAAIYLLTTWSYSPETRNLNILVPY